MCTPNESKSNPQLDALLAEAGWVLKLAKRLARDQAAAEDIAQGALALALEKRPAIEGGLRPWLATVVSRLARRNVRSDARRQAREFVVTSNRDSESDASDEVLMRFELQQDLARRVDSLPEHYRRVLVYRYYEGLSVKEIAVATGATPSTVRTQVERGLERIRLQYNDDSGSRGALGVFLIAGGSSTDFVSRRIAEILIMQTSTKVVAATACALVLAFAVISSNVVWPGTSNADNVESEVAQDELAQIESVAKPSMNAPVEKDVRVVAQKAIEDTEVPALGQATTPTVTTLRARILSQDSRPLVGATLSSLYFDEDQDERGVSPIAYSDRDGRVVLELNDDSVRKSRNDVYDMTFEVAAAGQTTQFLVNKPRLHGDTNLGDIRLSLGSAIVGMAVDTAGQGFVGAVLYAGASETIEDLAESRITGPVFGATRIRAVSQVDGRFELAGVSPKLADGRAPSVRVWAHAPGHLWTITEPITITSLGAIDIGRVLLEEAPDEMRLEGTVVRPDGLPAAGARVDFMSMGRPMEGHVKADSRGRFLIIPRDDSSLQLIARDANKRFGMSSAMIAKRGESVELKLLRQRRIVNVTVLDADGEPVADVHLRPVLEDGLVPGQDWSYTDELGHVEIVVPGQSFSVWARKAGYGSKHEGPFEHDSAPETLTITMSGGRVMTGRVLAYGEPVEGAKVAVMRLYEEFAAMTGGFPNRYPSGVHLLTTDSEGRFEAPLKLGWVELGAVARKDGLATGEVTLDSAPGESVHGIEIHMTVGGAIEGVVTPPPGMEAGGQYVGASRGDGLPLSTITDDKGRYRLEGLTPGNWRVEGRLREVRTELLSTSRHPEDMDPRWNAFVVDRETLKLDVDMRHLVEIKFAGQLRIDGAAPLPGWKADLVIPKHERDVAEVGAVALDSRGRFTLTTRATRAELRLVGPLPGDAMVEMVREIRFDGARFDWEGALTTVPIEEWVEGDFEQARFVRGIHDEGDRELTTVPIGEDGILEARVPVGRSSLQVLAKNISSDNTWDVIRVVEIR